MSYDTNRWIARTIGHSDEEGSTDMDDPSPNNAHDTSKLNSIIQLLSRNFETGMETDTQFAAITELAVLVFNAAAASIALINEEEQALEFIAACGEGGQEVVGQSIPLDTGIAGYVLMIKQPVAIPDVNQDPRFHHTFAESTGYVPSAIIATPLIRRDEVIGVMEVLDAEDIPGSRFEVLELLEIIGKLASEVAAQRRDCDMLLLNVMEGLLELEASKDLPAVRDLEKTIQASRKHPTQAESSDVVKAMRLMVQMDESGQKLAVKLLHDVYDHLR